MKNLFNDFVMPGKIKKKMNKKKKEKVRKNINLPQHKFHFNIKIHQGVYKTRRMKWTGERERGKERVTHCSKVKFLMPVFCVYKK